MLPERSSSEFSNHPGIWAQRVAAERGNDQCQIIHKKGKKTFSSDIYEWERIPFKSSFRNRYKMRNNWKMVSLKPAGVSEQKNSSFSDPFPKLVKGNKDWDVFIVLLLWYFCSFLERAGIQGWRHFSNTVIQDNRIRKTPMSSWCGDS